jgi:hypothetical protein
MEEEWRNRTYEINDLHEGHKIGKSKKIFILYNIKLKWGKSKCRKEHRGLRSGMEKYTVRRHDTLCNLVQMARTVSLRAV